MMKLDFVQKGMSKWRRNRTRISIDLFTFFSTWKLSKLFEFSFSSFGSTKTNVFHVWSNEQLSTFEVFFFVHQWIFLQDYIQTLSILVRGSVKEKLQWIFRFYDVDDNGKLTKEVWKIGFSSSSSNFWHWSMTIDLIRLLKQFFARYTIYLERTIVFINRLRKRHLKNTSVSSSM